MKLSQIEIDEALEFARSAFPVCTSWECADEEDGREDHLGFTMWGRYVPHPEDSMPATFFITFDTYKGSWRGYLTVGQHMYMWTSADFGDAHLVQSLRRPTLAEAALELKQEIKSLFRALCPT